ncbi:MAG: hypothetical protein CM15mP39_00750 [Synechococcus sp.]|nr:MAG: hypothetical protein CM15mP39_00750 [Synechococcus sp.]
MSLALMNIALTMLVVDLLAQSLKTSALPSVQGLIQRKSISSSLLSSSLD